MKRQNLKTKETAKDCNIFMFSELNRLSYNGKEYNLLPLISGAYGCLYFGDGITLNTPFRTFTKKVLTKVYSGEIKSHFVGQNIRNASENELYAYFCGTPKFDKFSSIYKINIYRIFYFFDSIQLLSMTSLPSDRINYTCQIQCLLDSVCNYFDKTDKKDIDSSFVLKNIFNPIVYGFARSYNEETKKDIITESGKDFFEFVFSLIRFMSEVNHGNVCEQEFFIQFFNKYGKIMDDYFLTNLTLSYFYNKNNEIICNFPFKYFKSVDPFYTEENPFIPIFYIHGSLFDNSMDFLYFILYEIWVGIYNDLNKIYADEKEQTLTKKNSELKTELKNSRKEINTLTSEKNEYPIKIKNLEKKVEKLQEEASNINCQHNEEIKIHKENYIFLNNKYEKLKNRNFALEEKVKELNKLLSSVKQYIPNTNGENEDLVEIIEVSNQEQELPIEVIINKLKNHRFLFIHGIQGYDKNLMKYFDKFSEVNINDKVANFIVPHDIDAVVVLTKTTPHSHIEHANKYKTEGIPTILTANKNIELVLRDIYTYFYN